MKTLSLFSSIAFGLFLVSNQAYAIDLQAGDLVAPTPDLTFAQVSYQSSSYGNKYVDGIKQAGNPKIEISQFSIRLGRSFEIADYPALFYAQTLVGYTHPEGALSPYKGDAGIGDTSMLLAIWPYANRETRTYWALGGYLTAPTGSYDNKRAFNMGGNRYQTALQTGYQMPLLDSLDWSATIDALWSGDNNDYLSGHKREQNVIYTAQTGLRYNINPTYAVAATYFYTTGGETTINAVNQHKTLPTFNASN
jgi:Putative MetA-pathway of phenol degradation